MRDYTEEEKAAILEEYERRRANRERSKDIEADFKSRGIPRTFMNWRTQMRKPAKGTPMPEQMTEAPEVLPGQMSLEPADTAPPVYADAVGEFDALPEGYAKTIQPMREYTEAEEWALNESMRLYGFIGAIVRDQYGRILDGNQRQRIARLRGLAVPYTISHVRDDAHAREIATSLNAVRRHYTPEQRQALVPILRDQGFSYRAIADALGVGASTVYRDVFGELRLRPEPVISSAGVPHETPGPPITETPVPHGTPDAVSSHTHKDGAERSQPQKKVRGRDGKVYPDRKPTSKPEPKPTPDMTGLKWVKIFQSMFAKYTETIETFQLEGGITVLARDMPPEARQLFLGLLREQAERWESMVAHFERTIAETPERR